MIRSICLTIGTSVAKNTVTLDGDVSLTILVGPNNSGKSALLESIYSEITSGKGRADKSSALDRVELADFSETILSEHPEFKGKIQEDIAAFGQGPFSYQEWIPYISNEWRATLGATFRTAFCIWMNGARRLTMLPDESGSSLTNPQTPLASMLTDDTRRQEFQEDIFSGIGYYPVIDSMSTYGQLKLAFSTEKPDPEIERSLNNLFSEYIGRSMSAVNASDGFLAYVGMLGAIYASDYKVVLIDEPEAFLHPALARTLGKQIATKAKEKQVYLATHSADFLMGVIESGAPSRIVRLQYQNGTSGARLLEGSALRQAMNDPLLRSADVMSGLFAKAVFVTEADADRAFYQEVNTRLLASGDQRAVDGAVFLNAQNKHTVPRIVGLLRRMGVPAVGVVDLDVLSEGRSIWTSHMDSIGLPAALKSGLENDRKHIHDALQAVSTDEKKADYKRRGGINLLPANPRNAALDLLDRLATYGLFVVPVGEIEQWLPELDISRSKHNWLGQIFEKMGSDPESADYVHPAADDVWDFIGKCKQWLFFPERKGMPE